MSVKTMSTLQNILVPTDFSPRNRAAIDYACDLAQDSDSALHLVNVSTAESETEREEILNRMGRLLEARTELNLETFKSIAEGNASSAIVEYAQKHDIDLIVMGSHGRTGLAHLTMGSVTEKVLRSAPCPVCVIGPNDAVVPKLDKVQRVIVAALEENLPAEFEASQSYLLNRIVEETRLTSVSAVLAFDKLRDAGWIQWNADAGGWSVHTDSIVSLGSEESAEEFKSESQAVELILRANQLRASDIHIDPLDAEQFRVRFRIDGQLRDYCHLQSSLAEHLCNQLKTMAQLDISDPFRPQEGRVRLPSALSDIEVRMTSVPVAEGQAAALRIADRTKVFLPLESLGFAEQSLRSIKEMLTNPEGLVLVTGPTGSGKTTSVYSMLQSISDESQNIVSIEDPVEYSAPYLRQIAVDEDHGLTMTVGLQTILRMDPDVIFLGEIRSPEAASIAIQAASSGKCVFSTLHTRSVASTIEAMRLLHPENRDLASSLAAIVNQRIVRRLCTECRYEIPVPETVAMKFQEFKLQVPEVLFKCKGCPRCDGTGTRGRIGVYEVALMDQAFRDAILAQVSVKQLQDLYINDNESEKRPSLIQDALQKAAEGLISVDDAMMIRWS